MSLAFWAVIVICLVGELALGSPPAKPEAIQRAKRAAMSMPDYLMSFGYIDKDALPVSNLRSGEELKKALKTLQKIGHIPETGEMDAATKALMKKPRCGMPDTEEGMRRKRYVHGDTKWDHKELSWNLDGRSLPYQMRRDDVRRDVRRALEVWARNSSLTFRELDGDPDADIQISFGARSHGDRHAFDGKGMILAHAFGPDAHNKIGGDTHFDAEEEWTLEYKHREGTHFFMVALHEFGHSLGLRHSDVMPSVMSPWYSGTDNSMLEQDDVVAIQLLYGRAEPEGRGLEPARERPFVQTKNRDTYQPPPREPPRERPREPPIQRSGYPAPPPSYPPRDPPREPPYYPPREPPYYPPREPPYYPPREPPNYPPRERPSYPANPAHRSGQESAPPRDPSSDRHADRPRVDQRQPYYPEHRPVPPRPHPTPDTSPANSPEACDISYDAVSLLRGELFIFKDDLLWRVRVPQFEARRDPPTLRKRLWKELPSGRIDAVYERPSGEIVFFVGRHFFVYLGTTLRDGPVPLANLGLPHTLDKIDAVTRWKGRTYLFSGAWYWRLDEETQRVMSGYPRAIADGWKGLDRDLDAALQWKDESTYFFKGKHFGKFDDERMRVEDMSAPAGVFWMNCKSSASATIHRAVGAALLLPLILQGFRYL